MTLRLPIHILQLMINIAAVVRQQNCSDQYEWMTDAGHRQIRPIDKGDGRGKQAAQIPSQVAGAYAAVQPARYIDISTSLSYSNALMKNKISS